MKKTFFWMAMLMLGLSCALWTGCSDDNNGGETPEEPGTPEVPGVTDTVYMIKSIRVNDLQNEGFYTLMSMTYTGKKVTAFTKAAYTPEGKVNGPVLSASLAYTAGKATLAYTRDGVDYEVAYTLDSKGYATKGTLYMLEEGSDPYLGSESNFSYNAKGMLSRIYTVMEESEIDIFSTTFKGDTIWNACLVDAEAGVTATCAFSDVKNNYTVDMNVFSVAYGYMEEIDYAIVCGLLPVSPKLLKTLTNEDEGIAVSYTSTLTDSKLSTLKMGMGEDLLKNLSFGY